MALGLLHFLLLWIIHSRHEIQTEIRIIRGRYHATLLLVLWALVGSRISLIFARVCHHKCDILWQEALALQWKRILNLLVLFIDYVLKLFALFHLGCGWARPSLLKSWRTSRGLSLRKNNDGALLLPWTSILLDILDQILVNFCLHLGCRSFKCCCCCLFFLTSCLSFYWVCLSIRWIFYSKLLNRRLCTSK